MREPRAYGKALATVAGVLLIANAVVTNVFVAIMTPESWGERALAALGWALVLTALTTLVVFLSTIRLRRGDRPRRGLLALLAFAGPAAAWTIVGLVVGEWLFPLYVGYGVGVGIVAGGVFALCGWSPSRSQRLA